MTLQERADRAGAVSELIMIDGMPVWRGAIRPGMHSYTCYAGTKRTVLLKCLRFAGVPTK